ncbi:glycosyltransferase [Erwinia oleae]|uniref:glycosyltransferase n=1 Tax=Erwinia oleae TaxID=796334 RepID=UPI00068BC703|nr:glycosyltransferase [Erwinia oleae]
MRLVIDMQGWQGSSRTRGIGRYTISIVKELIKINRDNTVILTFNGSYTDSIREFKDLVKIEGFQIEVWYPVELTSFIYEANKWNRKVSQTLYEEFHTSLKPDFLLMTSIFEGLIDHSVISISEKKNYPVGVILYDLIPYIYRDIYLTNDILKAWYDTQLEFLKKADYLFSISSSAGKEAVDYLNWDVSKVINVSTAADEIFFPTNINEEKKLDINKKYQLQDDFLMYTGGVDHRKNMEKLIESYSLLPNDLKEKHQLAIVCSMPDHVKLDLYKLGESFGLVENQLVLTGYVSDEELVCLYNLCYAFVFPSWHEGFGLPVLEAMLCGKPVITSNVSSLPEVIEFEDALFDPRDVNDITKKITQVLNDDDFRNKLLIHSQKQVKKFGWDISAKKLLDGISYFTENHKNETDKNGVDDKKQLALISPLTPEKSGISYYCADLLPYLSKYYKIKIVNDNIDVKILWKKHSVEVISVEEFKTQHREFDRILYQFGNSHFHSHMFELLNLFPGVVVMHDFYLSGVINWMLHTTNGSAKINDILYDSHGYNAVRFNNDRMTNDDAILEYPCNKDVLEGAKSIIFHSKSTIKLAESWYGNLFKSKYNHVPLLREPVLDVNKKNARKKLNIADNELLIISLGFVAVTKLNHKIIDAFNNLHNPDGSVKLVFVGHNSKGDYGQLIDEKISKSVCKDCIKITDWVSDDEYKLWLSAADIGIQLRTLSRGETSAAVLDCMNYGLATIANSNGSMSDLDPEAIILLDDNFDNQELTVQLQQLVADSTKRTTLGSRARNVIQTLHSPSECAKEYFNIIEGAYKIEDKSKLLNFESYKNELLIADDSKLKSLSQSISNSLPVDASSTIYIDVSVVYECDDSLELNDVVMNLSDSLHRNFRLEPIHFDGHNYKKAKDYAQDLFALSDFNIHDEIIDVVKNSHFIIYNPTAEHILKIADACHFISINNRITFMLWEDDVTSLEGVFSELGEDEREKIIDIMSCGDVVFSDNMPEVTLDSLKNRFPGAQKWVVKYLSPEMYIKQLLML